MPQNGLKIGSFHPFVHPKWSRMSFGKMRFDPFLTHSRLRIFKAWAPTCLGLSSGPTGLGLHFGDQNGPPQAQNPTKTLVLASHMV